MSCEFCFFCHSAAQPAGVPEILKKSLHSGSVRGGEELFIIGKNFLKGTKVIFQENIAGTSWVLSVLPLIASQSNLCGYGFLHVNL